MGKWLDEEVALPRWAWIGLMVIWFGIGGYVGVELMWRDLRPLVAPAPPARPKVVRIGADLVSAADMARAAGWEGDWRDYEAKVQEANGWAEWRVPLYAGDEVVLP